MVCEDQRARKNLGFTASNANNCGGAHRCLTEPRRGCRRHGNEGHLVPGAASAQPVRVSRITHRLQTLRHPLRVAVIAAGARYEVHAAAERDSWFASVRTDRRSGSCGRHREFIPCAAVERAAGAVFAHASPLLEKERDRGGHALVANCTRPLRIHRSSARSAFASHDDPVESRSLSSMPEFGPTWSRLDRSRTAQRPSHSARSSARHVRILPGFNRYCPARHWAATARDLQQSWANRRATLESESETRVRNGRIAMVSKTVAHEGFRHRICSLLEQIAQCCSTNIRRGLPPLQQARPPCPNAVDLGQIRSCIEDSPSHRAAASPSARRR